MTFSHRHSINLSRRGLIRPGAGFGPPTARHSGWGFLLFGVAIAAAAPDRVLAQCQPVWTALPGLDGAYVEDIGLSPSWPSAMPTLALVGGFLFAGATQQNWILEWDGWRWRAAIGNDLGSFLPNLYAIRATNALGPGHPLTGTYLGGSFAVVQPGGTILNSVARWANGVWSEPGGGITNGYILSLAATGAAGPGPPALYVSGPMLSAGGVPASGVARWDGTAWSGLGIGLSMIIPSNLGYAHAFEVYDDDGNGPRQPGLYVAGRFNYAGGVLVNHIARWDGAAWEALLGPGGPGLGGTPTESLKAFDHDGPGPAREMLYVGGTFNSAGGLVAIGLARWDGTTWSTVPGWPGAANVKAMEVFDDDGPGPRKPSLFAAGIFPQLGGLQANNIARWDGGQWHPLANGLTGGIGVTEINALLAFDEDGRGPNPGGLYAGGNFNFGGSGGQRWGIARWGCPLPPRCDANCTNDFHPTTGTHILTIADFACFQTRYVLKDALADCDEDGRFTIADFGCFQMKFVSGCP